MSFRDNNTKSFLQICLLYNQFYNLIQGQDLPEILRTACSFLKIQPLTPLPLQAPIPPPRSLSIALYLSPTKFCSKSYKYTGLPTYKVCLSRLCTCLQSLYVQGCTCPELYCLGRLSGRFCLSRVCLSRACLSRVCVFMVGVLEKSCVFF